MSICYLLDGETPPARQNGKRLPCERLYAEKEELQAENAKLFELDARLFDKTLELATENAELRKLLTDFRDAIWSSGEWTEPFDERMRELGVKL